MRLIDADWVLGHLKPYEQSDEEWSVTGGTALRLIHGAVDNAPTVDAVVVTRCKDCKHSYEDAFGRACNYGICGDCTVSDDFYCASGEPKEKPNVDNHD